MTEMMTADRFQAIVDAYGAQAERWPAAERQAALDFVADHAEAQIWLDAAGAVDGLLDGVWAADHVHADADQRVFETALERFGADFAPAANVVVFPGVAPVKSRRGQWSLAWPVLGGIGIGLAACIAGAVLGVNLSLMGLTDLRAQTVLEQVAMIDTGE